MSTIVRESGIRRLQSYGIPGRFGGVLAAGRGGPAERPVRELVDCPARVLLEPMVLPTLWAAVAQAGPAACLVRDVVLEVTGGGGPSTTRPGAAGVSDLGQVPELDPGIMALGLEPVIALAGIDRVEADQQIRPGSRDAQPPGPGFSRGREGESRPVRARFRWRLGSGRAQPWATACPCASVTVTHHVVFGLRAAAAARSWASHGSTGPIPGISPGRSASQVSVASGTVRVTRPANPLAGLGGAVLAGT